MGFRKNGKKSHNHAQKKKKFEQEKETINKGHTSLSSVISTPISQREVGRHFRPLTPHYGKPSPALQNNNEKCFEKGKKIRKEGVIGGGCVL
jgi:hypothetical protein